MGTGMRRGRWRRPRALVILVVAAVGCKGGGGGGGGHPAELLLLEVGDVKVGEPDSGAVEARFPVRLSQPSARTNYARRSQRSIPSSTKTF